MKKETRDFFKKNLILLLGVVLTLLTKTHSAQAAAPLTHIYLAKKMLQLHPVLNQRLFLVGTLFPDIRYLGVISREKTHFKKMTLLDIVSEKSDFMAGMKLHSFVDEVREKFAVNYGIYKKIKKIESKYHATFLKLAEDEVLWDESLTHKQIQDLSATTLEEINFPISPKASINQWHQYLIDYFKSRPSKTIKELASKNSAFFNVPAERVKVWAQKFETLIQDKEFKKYVHLLDNHFQESFLKVSKKK